VLGLHALRHVAAVVHRLGGLDAEGRGLRKLVHELEHLLVFGGGQVVVLQRAPGDDEEEQAPHLGAHVLPRSPPFPAAAHVAARHGGLKLRVEADVSWRGAGRHGAVEGAGDAAEIVVRGGVRSVHADRHARDAGSLKRSMASLVSSGVALGVTLVRRPISTL
jgi:hypothetical protein